MNDNHKIETILNDIGAECVPQDVHELAESITDAFQQSVSGDLDAVPHKSQASKPTVRPVPDVPTELADGVSREAYPIEQPPNKRHVKWRFGTMFQSKTVRWFVTVIASAAVVVLVVTTLNTQSSITLADVVSAVAEQSWVHVRYDNGREEWTNLKTGRSFLREVGGIREGLTMFLDPVAGIRMTYWPNSGELIHKDHISSWPTPRTPWEMVIGTPEQQALLLANGAAPDLQEEIVDGRRLLRMDYYIIDALGKRIVVEQIWADPATRLPVRVMRKLDLAARQAQNREYITGEYKFPETGPSCLEDLGVPPNLPVVEADQPTPQDVQQIIEAGAAAKEQFPTRYRVIRYERSNIIGKRSISSFNSNNIRIFWRDDNRFRLDNYSNLSFSKDDDPQRAKYHLDLPATTEQILAWTATQEDVHGIYVYANGKAYSRRNPHPAIINAPKQPEARALNLASHREPMLVSSPNWPHNQPWPYIVGKSGCWQVLPQSEDLKPGCVGLRCEAGDQRRDCIIDPAHDYICVNYIQWKQEDGQWIKDRQDQLLDLQQLPTGQWYPMQWKIVGWTLGSHQERHETVHQDVIHPLEESDLPVDLFNGEKLLEGAKVETY